MCGTNKLYNMKTNLEGRYTSTYGFVGNNELEKQAETTFGKDWEAEFDVEQIQELCDIIHKGRYIVDCIDTRDDEDIVVREVDNWDDFIRLATDLECARIENERLQDLSNAQHLKDISSDLLKEELEKRGYCTNNLWHISDVQQNYVCEDDQAMEVLEVALENEYIVSQTFDAIDMWIECNSEQGEFKPKD